MCNVCAKILTSDKHAYTHTKHRHEHTYIHTYCQEVNLQLYICVYSLITAQGLLHKFLGKTFGRYAGVLRRRGNHIFSHIDRVDSAYTDTFLIHTLTHNVVYICNAYLHVMYKIMFVYYCLQCIVSGQAVCVCARVCVCANA